MSRPYAAMLTQERHTFNHLDAPSSHEVSAEVHICDADLEPPEPEGDGLSWEEVLEREAAGTSSLIAIVADRYIWDDAGTLDSRDRSLWWADAEGFADLADAPAWLLGLLPTGWNDNVTEVVARVAAQSLWGVDDAGHLLINRTTD